MDIQSPEVVPCSSILNPLWAYLSDDYPEKGKDMSASIGWSDVDATDRLVENCGGIDGAVQRLNLLVGEAEFVTTEHWGEVMVTAGNLASAYEALLKGEKNETRDIFGAMRYVVKPQRTEVPRGIRMKAGWTKCILKKRPVLVTSVVIIDHRDIVHAGTSVQRVTREVAAYWGVKSEEDMQCVLPLHDNFLGEDMWEVVKDKEESLLLSKSDLEHLLVLE